MVVDIVDRFRKVLRSVLGKGERIPPLVRQPSRAILLLRILVISRCGDNGNRRVNEVPGLEPLTPLAVPVSYVDQVSRVQEEVSLGGFGIRRPDGPGPETEQVVLRVPEVGEGERGGTCVRGPEMEPLTPDLTATDPVGILSRRVEVFKGHGVAMKRIAGGLESFHRGTCPGGVEPEVRRADRLRNLRL